MICDELEEVVVKTDSDLQSPPKFCRYNVYLIK